MGAGGATLGRAEGRTTVAGTFRAEKTHSNPPEYTLVSVTSPLTVNRPSGPVGARSSSPRAQQRTTKAVRGLGVSAQTPLALELLLEDTAALQGKAEEPESPEKSASGRQLQPPTPATAPSRTGSSPRGTPARGRGSPRTASRQSSSRRRGCSSAGQDTAGPVSGDGAESGVRDRADVFSRLAADVQRPWVATKTDAQLLAYLAQRSHDPQIAAPSTSCDLSYSLQSTSLSTRSQRRQRFKNHRELFDECLRRDAMPDGRLSPALPRRPASPPVGLSTMSWKGTGKLADMLEEIKVLPEDAVAFLLDNEKAGKLAAKYRSP